MITRIILTAVVGIVASIVGLVYYTTLPIDFREWGQTIDISTENLRFIKVKTAPSVTLNVIETGKNATKKGKMYPLIIMLHGFPETALTAWHQHLRVMHSTLQFYVLAPDMRGYNKSSKPTSVQDYHISHLINDIRELIKHSKRSEAFIIGHDWGGTVAWVFAQNFPEMVTKLMIINSPHPYAFSNAIFSEKLEGGWRTALRQIRSSWYILLFQLPSPIPEKILSFHDFQLLKSLYTTLGREGRISRKQFYRFVDGWREPGALTSMINYYRALTIIDDTSLVPKNTTVKKPTLILWGKEDTIILPEIGRLSFEIGVDESVRNVSRFVPLERTGHFAPLQNPSAIARLLLIFLKE
jgi:pimeloyl-ACP methyl ester carboxylesterase